MSQPFFSPTIRAISGDRNFLDHKAAGLKGTPLGRKLKCGN